MNTNYRKPMTKLYTYCMSRELFTAICGSPKRTQENENIAYQYINSTYGLLPHVSRIMLA